MAKVLIVEDDTSFGLMLAKFLEKKSFECECARSFDEALAIYKEHAYDVVITDLKLPGSDGIDLLKAVKEIDPKQRVVLMTSYGHIKTAVRAIKLGAFEYITKPINHEELLGILKEASKPDAVTKTDRKKSTVDFNFIVGTSPSFQEVLDQANLVAGTDMSVLILGESGTGKEYLSRYIHQHSKRSDKPFVAVDCGALSNELAGSELFGHVKGAFTGALQDKLGQFAIANEGTIFLDEIGNLSYEIQIQLLRAIQEKFIKKVGEEKPQKVDVRVIAATNESLKKRVTEGSFREDLFHRINEFQIDIPPLRERTEDLRLFIDEFISQSNEEFEKEITGITADAEKLLFGYAWTGNIRELKNVIRRAVLVEKTARLQASSFPSFISEHKDEPRENTGSDLKETHRINEIEMISNALQQTKYNKTQAAKILNIDRTTLYEKIKKYNL